MKGSTIIIIGLVVVVGGFFLIRQNPMLLGSLKMKLQRITGNLIKPISGELNAGTCTCQNDILYGANCYPAGQRCSSVENTVKNFANCLCIDGTYTGLNCPNIGKPCSGAQNFGIPMPKGPRKDIFPNATVPGNEAYV